MSARVESRKMPAKRNTKSTQIIKGFDAKALQAPFLLRCGALIIDYILLVSVPAVSILLGRFMGDDGAKLLNSPISNTGWLIMILLGLTNVIIFPIFSGQSIGKMFTGLRITNMKGENPGFGKLILRHLIGYPITLITGGLGFLLAIVTPNGRALHDYLSGTMVVYGRKEVKTKKYVKRIGSENSKTKDKK